MAPETIPDPGPEATANPPGYRWARIIFWGLCLYGIGLAIMVLEDFLNHSFI
jgi:hypothetical protein